MSNALVVSAVLTILGAGLLAVALHPATRIIRRLPAGAARSRWAVLRGFIVAFIAGYLLYLFLFIAESAASSLLVSSIFALGACFVVLVCFLADATVHDILRISALEAENVTDPLMGIFNRRYLERRLQEEFDRARRYGLPLCVLMTDIDHFKRINDLYGHACGDAVLREVGALLRKSTRSVDVVARYGGEEIVAILPHTGESEAVILAERIRRTIDAHSFAAGGADGFGHPVRCSVSIGVAVLTPECAAPGRLLEMADAALYRAKEGGRNRVVMFRCDKEGAAASPPA